MRAANRGRGRRRAAEGDAVWAFVVMSRNREERTRYGWSDNLFICNRDDDDGAKKQRGLWVLATVNEAARKYPELNNGFVIPRSAVVKQSVSSEKHIHFSSVNTERDYVKLTTMQQWIGGWRKKSDSSYNLLNAN